MVYSVFIIFVLFIGLIIKINSIKFEYSFIYASRQYFFIILFIAWLIMGLRANSVGRDTEVYAQYFELYHDKTFGQLWRGEIEPGWSFLAWVINNIGGSYLFFQLVFSAIFISASYKFLTYIVKLYHIKYYITIAIVFISSTYLLSFNIARQMMAVVLILNAWICYTKKDRFKTIFFCIAAVSFHYTSIIGVCIIVLWSMLKYKYIGIFCFGALIGLYLGFKLIIQILVSLNLYVNYVNNAFGSFQEANLSKIVWFIVAIHGIYIILKQKTFSSKEIFVAINCLIWVFTNILSSEINYFERLGLYFLPFVCLIYPCVGSSFKNKSIRFIYFSGVSAMYSAWFMLGAQSEQYKYTIAFFN